MDSGGEHKDGSAATRGQSDQTHSAEEEEQATKERRLLTKFLDKLLHKVTKYRIILK